MNSKKRSQAGFAHLEMIGVVLVIAVISFIGGTVYIARRGNNANTDNTSKVDDSVKQTPKTESSEDELKEVADEEEKKVEPSPPPPPPKKTNESTEKPKTDYVEKTKFTIETTLAEVREDDVRFTAKLGKELSGNCEVMVKSPSGVAKYYQGEVSNDDSCTIEVTRAKITEAGQWKFQMIYYNDEHTLKGYSDYNLFTID